MDEEVPPKWLALRKLRASAIEPIPLVASYLGSFRSRDIPADAGTLKLHSSERFVHSPIYSPANSELMQNCLCNLLLEYFSSRFNQMPIL